MQPKITQIMEYMNSGAGSRRPKAGPMMAAMPHMISRGCHIRSRRWTKPATSSPANTEAPPKLRSPANFRAS